MSEQPRQFNPIEKVLLAIARSRLGGWFFVNVAPVIDRRLIPLTKGKISTAVGQPIGLLTMTGAKSGLPREVPLFCTPDGDNWIVVASRGGDSKHPAWYFNLRAHPEITLYIFGHEGRYRAYETSGAEREAAWKKAANLYPGYNDYATRTGGRQIPVFVLKPLGD